VEFIWLTSPKSFIGETKVNEVEVNKMNLAEPDSSGRRRPEIEVGSEYRIPADLVIKSLGFDPENIPKLFNAEELAISQWGTIKIDLRSMQTNLDGVFAAGDIVRGASLVVWAIRDGRDAAIQIEKYLQQKINKNKSVKAA
jgi:glutamate synthase (NADPH/NADH) small chain